MAGQRRGGAGGPLVQLAQHQRRFWLQAELPCGHRSRVTARPAPETGSARRYSRLNCEAALGSEALTPQLEEGGGGAPRPGRQHMEALLPWVLVGGAWEEGSGPRPGPFSCSRI